MLNKGIRKYLSNPVIGLLPFIAFIVLHIMNVKDILALSIAIGLVILGEIFIRAYFKTRSFSITFYISGISLLLTLIFWIFSYRYNERVNTYIIICEIFVVFLFILLRISKTYIGTHFFRQKNLFQKALLSEFYSTAAILQYALTFHLFGILLYQQFSIKRIYVDTTDVILISVLPILIMLFVAIYQIYKVSTLSAKLHKEEWIPIVTEKGEVTGKIAKSISVGMKNRFLHPVVRVALISDSKVYLQKRSTSDILNPEKLDYPFEKYMLFNHEINLAVRNSIRRMVGEDMNFSIKFVLKYVFENDDTKRLNFLFVANTTDEEEIKRSDLMIGKFWTVRQIEESFADEIFSECFELEFEYLKNMILLPSHSY